MLFIKNGKPLSWMASPRDPKTARSFSFAQTSPRVNQPWRHRAGNHGILSLKMGQFPTFLGGNFLDDLWKKACFFDLWFGWLPLIVVRGCCRCEFKSWIALVFAGLSVLTFGFFFPDVPWEAQTQCVNRVLPKMSHTGSFQLLSMLTLCCFCF